MEDMVPAYQVPSAHELREESIKYVAIPNVKELNELLDGMKAAAANGKFIYKGLVKKEFAGSEVHHLLLALKYQVAVSPLNNYRDSIVVTWYKPLPA